MVALLGVAALLATGSASLRAADLPAVTAQLAAINTLDGKLAFLKQAAGLSEKEKATLGASVIESVAPADQKAAAVKVALTLSAGERNTARFAALLTNALPSRLGASLAGSIAIGAGQADPTHLPQIAAAVIVANSATIANAAAIAGEVTTAAPLSITGEIASAIGSTFSQHHNLAQKAPEIAASMTSAIVTKGTQDQVRPQVANTVAALTALLPGSVSDNKALIVSIGKAVAAVIAPKYPGLATTVVGVTSAALKAAAGTADIGSVLTSFSDTFRDAISDPVIQGKLSAVVADVNQGGGGKDIAPLEKPIAANNASQLPPVGVVAPKTATYPGAPGAPADPGSFFFWTPQATPTPTPTATPGPVVPTETPVS